MHATASVLAAPPGTSATTLRRRTELLELAVASTLRPFIAVFALTSTLVSKSAPRPDEGAREHSILHTHRNMLPAYVTFCGSENIMLLLRSARMMPVAAESLQSQPRDAAPPATQVSLTCSALRSERHALPRVVLERVHLLHIRTLSASTSSPSMTTIHLPSSRCPSRRRATARTSPCTRAAASGSKYEQIHQV